MKAKYRCNKAKVLKIQDTSDQNIEYHEAYSAFWDKQLKYRVGEIVCEHNYTNNNKVLGEGIHFFLDKEVALIFGLSSVNNGLYRSWHDNGQKHIECEFFNRRKHGMYLEWCKNGNMIMECNFIKGRMVHIK